MSPSLKKRKVAFTETEKSPKAEKVAPAKKISLGKGKAKAEIPQAASSSPSTHATPTQKFKVIAGSYEKLLYGLEVTLKEPLSESSIQPIFIFPAHLSCVKALATSPQGGKWLATGAADEIIKVWDLRRRKEVGGLVQHEGSITSLCFPTRSHMFSTSEDGTIAIFRVRDWVPLRTMRGHKGRVNHVAIHPSLKVALSVGQDGMLRMWDLKKAKSVASTKLGKEGEIIRWSIKGDRFAVLSGNSIDVYSTEMKPIRIINHKTRLHDIRFIQLSNDRECLLVAAEDKTIAVYDLEGSEVADDTAIWAKFVGHGNRVKAIDVLRIPTEGGSAKVLLTSVSSDGFILLYDTSELEKHTPDSELLSIEPFVRYDTKGTRLTCVTFAEDEPAPSAAVNGHKRKHSEDVEDGDSVSSLSDEES